MMRVPVDPATLDPAGPPEFVAGGRYWDDFVLDEDAGVAYVTTHRQNTIDRVNLAADGNRDGFVVAAGNPFTETLVGPSSGVLAPRRRRLRPGRLLHHRRRHRRVARRRGPGRPSSCG